jgi:hypothetical protein
MTDLATLTAILYGARYQRRVPESDAEKHRMIAEAATDATLIVELLTGRDSSRNVGNTPEQPPPSPGNQTGVLAEAKEGRRRTANGRWTATGS